MSACAGSRRSSESPPPGCRLRPSRREIEVLPGELSRVEHVVLRDNRLDNLALMIEDDVVDLPPLVIVREFFRDIRRENRLLDRVGDTANPPEDPPRVVVIKGPQHLRFPKV